MLYLFTTSYPYGADGVFLEEEIKYLSKSFDRIMIVPLENFANNSPSHLPPNISLAPPILKERTRFQLYRLFDVRLFSLFWHEFFKNKVYCNKRRIKEWVVGFIHTSAILSSESVKTVKGQLMKEDICYFYWGVDAYILAYFWRGCANFVSRFHGSCDLWEEGSAGYKVLRTDIMKSLKLAVPISDKGRIYLKNKYPLANIVTSRLGTIDYGVTQKSNDGIVRIVSCSNVIPLKRVDLIFSALNSMKDICIEWTHIGCGSEFNYLKSLIKKHKNSHLSVSLKGSIDHGEVMKYYQDNKVDVFINLSTIEGIPVSAIEAISFNIPVIATDVGATSEVVTKDTGYLLGCNPTLEDISKAIKDVLTRKIDSRNYWECHYKATVNYTNFITLLKK